MSVFDGIADLAVDVTSDVFGDTATWVNGDTTYSGLVKYKDELGSAKLGDVKYGVDHWHIEIKDSNFPGLKDMINANRKPVITVSVRGVNTDFVGIQANAISDGRCTDITLRAKPV